MRTTICLFLPVTCISLQMTLKTSLSKPPFPCLLSRLIGASLSGSITRSVSGKCRGSELVYFAFDKKREKTEKDRHPPPSTRVINVSGLIESGGCQCYQWLLLLPIRGALPAMLVGLPQRERKRER